MSKWSTDSDELDQLITRALVVGEYTDVTPIEYIRQHKQCSQ